MQPRDGMPRSAVSAGLYDPRADKPRGQNDQNHFWSAPHSRLLAPAHWRKTSVLTTAPTSTPPARRKSRPRCSQNAMSASPGRRTRRTRTTEGHSLPSERGRQEELSRKRSPWKGGLELPCSVHHGVGRVSTPLGLNVVVRPASAALFLTGRQDTSHQRPGDSSNSTLNLIKRSGTHDLEAICHLAPKCNHKLVLRIIEYAAIEIKT